MKNIKEQIAKLESENSFTDYNITKVFLSEDKAKKIIEQLENEKNSLLDDLEYYDQIVYTDKLNWMDFIYTIKKKIDQVNYLDSMDNYQYDYFRDLIIDKPDTINVHYNDKLDLGMIKYDFDKVIIFDEAHENEIEEMLKGKVEAYVLPNYDKNIIEQIIEKL